MFLNRTMYVTKRNSVRQELSFDKIAKRIRELANDKKMGEVLDRINVMEITIEVIKNIVNNISTTELDNITANICFARQTEDTQYETLAARVAVSNLHKNTCGKFSQMIDLLYSKDLYFSEKVHNLVMLNAQMYDEMIDDMCDYQFDFFAIESLRKMYLLVLDGVVVERPQYLWLRVAIEIHGDKFDAVKETYDLLSQGYFIHATPTLFNSLLRKNQLSSCMLVTNKGDSVDEIFDTIKQCAILGANAAGIGLSVSNIRANGSLIKSTGRPSKGVPSFMMIHDITSTVIDQGGKRNMSQAVYIEPWHADFMDIINLRANHNMTAIRARDLFYAVWSNNVLYERAINGEMWSFFCPTDAPRLLETYGDEFKAAYLEYESRGVARGQMPAQKIYMEIAALMIETGQPYHLNKDACNAKSNMKNVAHINSSNLCAEILIPSGNIDGHNEIGVCTLASINLSKFVKPAKLDNYGHIAIAGEFQYDKLYYVASVITQNLNNIIDNQYYPLADAERSSRRHRPIGIGIQGLANVFMLMGYPYESDEARELNWRIMECIYAGAINKSMEMAREYGSYETFEGSPASQGILQPQLWVNYGAKPLQYTYDWDTIGKNVANTGLRNALLIACMPTAGTSQILGCYSSFEPAVANIFTRHTMAGDFTILNKHLVKNLKDMGLWSVKMKDKIIAYEGSIQDIVEIPDQIKNIYRTVWEMKQKTLMEYAADRGQFICQTQSYNLFIDKPSVKKITALINYGMKLGLKTISYYTRSRSAKEAVKFTIDRDLDNAAVAASKVKVSDRVKVSDKVSKNKSDTLEYNNDKLIESNVNLVCKKEDGCVSCSS